MALSIKDSDTEAKVRRLARVRGTSLTGAIRLAVENELAREPRREKKSFDQLWAEVQEIQKRYAALGGGMSAAEMDDWMYDENGLPR